MLFCRTSNFWFNWIAGSELIAVFSNMISYSLTRRNVLCLMALTLDPLTHQVWYYLPRRRTTLGRIPSNRRLSWHIEAQCSGMLLKACQWYQMSPQTLDCNQKAKGIHKGQFPLRLTHAVGILKEMTLKLNKEGIELDLWVRAITAILCQNSNRTQTALVGSGAKVKQGLSSILGDTKS